MGNDLAWKHPQILAITDCDTMFMFLIKKVKVLKKCMKQVQKVNLLNGFSKTSAVGFKVSQNAAKFV